MRNRAWLILSGLLMALYATYAVWGAFAKQLGTPVPIRLGDVGEFWLFFLSIVGFHHPRDHRRAPPAARARQHQPGLMAARHPEMHA